MRNKTEGEVDELDDILNGLDAGEPRERARRAPEITPAPEAIEKARRQPEPEKKPSSGTFPMTNAPTIPKQAPRAHSKNRRNDPTMFTGAKIETTSAPRGRYLKAAAVAFFVVLGVGALTWRAIDSNAAKSSTRVDANDPHIVATNATGNATATRPNNTPRNSRLEIPPPPVLTDSTAIAPLAPLTATPPNQAPNANARSSTEPRASSSTKNAPGNSAGVSLPNSKYGSMIDPTAP